ncbi:hypothetical protein SAMN05216188_12754 [Lentzea xinjiangensis]|uniref:Uncharacterized protein n=1 Tax=Lentzea xinjiangensis TaxID=402600 RepID=A0A1H9VP42_9PSEU|nr:hypothetical protein SAMN05216188_12754 [Lentzea xinjiangensis]
MAQTTYRVNTQLGRMRALSILGEVVAYHWYAILAADEAGEAWPKRS